MADIHSSKFNFFQSLLDERAIAVFGRSSSERFADVHGLATSRLEERVLVVPGGKDFTSTCLGVGELREKMILHTFGSAAIAVMHLLCLSNAEHPDAVMPSDSDQELKIKPLFEAKVVNGWSIWPQGERAYKVFVQKATWDEAEEICQQNDAHLASIGSEEENDFIYNLVKDMPGDWFDAMTWIGGKYDWLVDDWFWVDGAPLSYTNWSPDEPNNYLGNEYCMEIAIQLPVIRTGAGLLLAHNGVLIARCWRKGNQYSTMYKGGFKFPGWWNDHPCDTKMQSFVCRASSLKFLNQ
ncbi:lectin C-type domain protein [Ostertagia ostertagi]